jgi:hypothetical protein
VCYNVNTKGYGKQQDCQNPHALACQCLSHPPPHHNDCGTASRPLSTAYNLALTEKMHVAYPGAAAQNISMDIQGAMSELLKPLSANVASVTLTYQNFRGAIDGKPIPQFGDLNGVGMTSRVNREGQSSDLRLTGLQNLPPKARAALSSTISSFKQMSQSVFLQVPNHPVKVGQSWTVHTSANISGLAVGLHYVYTYDGLVHGALQIAAHGNATFKGQLSTPVSGTITLAGQVRLTPKTHMLLNTSINETENITVTSASGKAAVHTFVNTTVARLPHKP